MWAPFARLRAKLESNNAPSVQKPPIDPGAEVAHMTTLPIVIRAVYGGDYRIRLAFNDGLEKTVDFREWLNGPVFEPLKDRAYFQRFFVDGGTVCWPNGADIAPETLYASREANEAARVPSHRGHSSPGSGGTLTLCVLVEFVRGATGSLKSL
jgi:hypothetical protein